MIWELEKQTVSNIKTVQISYIIQNCGISISIGFLWISENGLLRRGLDQLRHEDSLEEETFAKSWFDGEGTEARFSHITIGSSVPRDCSAEKSKNKSERIACQIHIFLHKSPF